ncbi:hypothetical protein C0J52_21676 [Blattella germanica]|nr:hypothetical protein C0J52_21676 [Blattella germanica]
MKLISCWRLGNLVNNHVTPYMRKGAFGLKYLHRSCEYLLPKFMNRKWQKDYATYSHTSDVKKFLKLYREKLFVDRRKAERRDLNHVLGLLKRFPNLDEEAVKEQYPSVDIQKIRYHKKTRGHHKNIC